MFGSKFGVLSAAAIAATAALALSGCGGGGGGTDGTATAPPPKVIYSKAAPAASMATAIAPSHKRQPHSHLRTNFVASVRQNLDYLAVFQNSAGVSSDDNHFILPMAVLAVPRNSTGPITYAISFNGSAVLKISNARTVKHLLFLNTSGGNERWNQASAVHGTVGSLSRVVLSADTKDGWSDREDYDDLVAQAVVITDFDVTANDHDESVPDDPITSEIDESMPDATGDDTDYVAVGVWVIGPSSGNDPENLTAAGTFASGKVPYPANQYGSLGLVSYSGHVVGKRFSGGSERDFSTTVSLTADFGSTPTVSGMVADVGGGQTLTLESTSLNKGAAGGPFKGDTQLVGKDGVDVAGFEGKWGGAFFGKADTTNGPPTAAGTFGAANSDNSDSVLGAFLAHRD